MKYTATPRIMTRRNRPAIQSDRGRLSYVTGWPIFVQSTLDERLSGLKLEAVRFFCTVQVARGYFDTLLVADFMSLSPRSCWEAILSSPSGLRSSGVGDSSPSVSLSGVWLRSPLDSESCGLSPVEPGFTSGASSPK